MNADRDFVCGTCDFKSVLAEKLQSHYASKHKLSTHDANVLAYGNLGFDLSFEQQQELTEILEGYRSNPSNSNKFRYNLFGKIEEIARERA